MESKPKILAVIPARYGSTRFPGKPLAMLGGHPVIEWVYRRVHSAIDDVVVATDDSRILTAVEAFGGRAVLTSAHHTSGTSRVGETVKILGSDADIVVNVQGDEPFISSVHLEVLLQCFYSSDAGDVEIATLVCPFPRSASYEELSDPNVIKAAVDTDSGYVLWFSRLPIPFLRSINPDKWASQGVHYRHIGVYAFARGVLPRINSLAPSVLEESERLEQLRWLAAGYRIKAGKINCPTIGIDTPADLQKATLQLKSHPLLI